MVAAIPALRASVVVPSAATPDVGDQELNQADVDTAVDRGSVGAGLPSHVPEMDSERCLLV